MIVLPRGRRGVVAVDGASRDTVLGRSPVVVEIAWRDAEPVGPTWVLRRYSRSTVSTSSRSMSLVAVVVEQLKRCIGTDPGYAGRVSESEKVVQCLSIGEMDEIAFPLPSPLAVRSRTGEAGMRTVREADRPADVIAGTDEELVVAERPDRGVLDAAS